MHLGCGYVYLNSPKNKGEAGDALGGVELPSLRFVRGKNWVIIVVKPRLFPFPVGFFPGSEVRAEFVSLCVVHRRGWLPIAAHAGQPTAKMGGGTNSQSAQPESDATTKNPPAAAATRQEVVILEQREDNVPRAGRLCGLVTLSVPHRSRPKVDASVASA